MHTTPKNGKQGKAVFAKEGEGVLTYQPWKNGTAQVSGRTQRELRWQYALQLHAANRSRTRG